MVKKQRIFVTSIIMLFATTLMVSCTQSPQENEAPVTPSHAISDEALGTETMESESKPTLSAPIISVATVETVVLKPTEPQPSPTLEIIEETAVPPTEPPAAAHTSVPLPTPLNSNLWTLRVPILMYHYISEPPADADIYRTDLSVAPENFRQQMAYLAENGYTPIDLYQLSAAVTSQIELPEKPVILTFDDGYLDNYENAFPILQEFDFIGTFFIITDLADQGAEGYATWEQLEEMAAAGMRLESHTKSHPDLTTLGRDGVIFQALGSQETIAAHIGYTPRYLCYPGGRYTEETMQILSELDFWGAVTTQGGTWHHFGDRYEWSRQRMRYTTTLDQFKIFIDPDGTVSGKTIDTN